MSGNGKFRVQAFNKAINRADFCSSSEALNRYFQQQVSQDIKRRIATCFVALNMENEVAGYYTLASTSIVLGDLPEHLAQKLPRHPTIPAVLMGRLAVDKRYTGQGLGGALLAYALWRAAYAEIAAYAVLVDAKDEAAVQFYRHFGFLPFVHQPFKLFFPLASINQIKGCTES